MNFHSFGAVSYCRILLKNCLYLGLCSDWPVQAIGIGLVSACIYIFNGNTLSVGHSISLMWLETRTCFYSGMTMTITAAAHYIQLLTQLV